MRFNAALASALVSSAGLMGYVHAEDEVPAADATSAVERPTFTVRGFSLYTLVSSANPTVPLAYHHQGSLRRAIHR